MWIRRMSWRARAATACAWVPLLLVLSVSPASAAKIKNAGVQRPVTSPEARAQLQRILQQNAPVLEAQATVL